MEFDIFGIKFGTDENTKNKGRAIEKTYRINKEEMLKDLGFNPKTTTYIAYDYKKGELTIKTRELPEEDNDLS